MKEDKKNMFNRKLSGVAVSLLALATIDPALADDPHIVEIGAHAVPGILSNRIDVVQSGKVYTDIVQQHATMRVDGEVVCKSNTAWDGGHWVYGSASAPNGEYKLTPGSYEVKQADGIGYDIQGDGVPPEGAAPFDMPIPISYLTQEAPASLRIDPVKACNGKLAEHVSDGGSKIDFLRNDQFITVKRPFTMVSRCTYDGVGHSKGYGHDDFEGVFTVVCKGDPGVKPESPSKDAPSELKTPYHATHASLKALPAMQTAECPTKVKFNGLVSVSEPGKPFKYRIVGAGGFASPVYGKTMETGKITANIQFEVEVGKQSEGMGFKAQPNIGDDNSVFDLKAAPTDIQSGWYAIQVIEPSKVTSNQAHFSVKCKQDKSATDQLVNPGSAKPKPGIDGPANLKTKGLRLQSILVKGADTAHQGACPAKLAFNAEIRAAGTGQLQYQWVTDKGYKGPVESVMFNNQGKQVVSRSIRFNKTENGRMMLKLVGKPSNANSVAYRVDCDLGFKNPDKGDKGIKDLKDKKRPKQKQLQLKSN